MRILKITGIVALVTVAAGCAMMVPPEEDPMYLKMTEIDNRLSRIERLVDNEGLNTLIRDIKPCSRKLRPYAMISTR